MVDITLKPITVRTARARVLVKLGHELLDRIERNQIAKGNVLTVAKTAAIIGAKWTSHLIPLCHQIALDHVDVEFRVENENLIIETECRATHRTGVEIKAITAAMIAAITIYDMCKAVNKSIIIHQCRLVMKEGGKSSFKLLE